MPLDKNPLVISEFKGKLVTDADYLDTTIGEQKQIKIPFDYALESVNLNFLKKGGMRTREGIDKYMMQAVHYKPIQMWKIEELNGVAQTDRWLIMTTRDAGTQFEFWDTGTVAPPNPILSGSRAEYAYVINAFGRMYIALWTAYRTPADTANAIYVYNGAYAARPIRSPDPVIGAPAFAVSAVAGGFVTVGLHYCSVLFETDTGFISSCIPEHLVPPPPASMIVTTTAANSTIRFANIPLGPAGSGVIKRHLIVTKVVVNPTDRGFFGYEPFFAHTINDNVTNAYNFTKPDSALVESAKNYLPSAPVADVPYTAPNACLAMAMYGNRMVYMFPTAPYGAFYTRDRNLIIVSDANRPEQFDITVNTAPAAPPTRPPTHEGSRNAISIGPDFSGGISAGAELNGVFYIFKDDSTFSIVNDDTLDPIEWQKPALIDSGKGAFPFAVANVGNNPSSDLDGVLLVGGRHGLTFFNGKFAERSLAEAIWDQYAIADLKWLKVLVDPIRQLIFLRLGDFSASAITKFPPGDPNNNRILIGNYYYGTDITTIRWGAWQYAIDQAGNPWTYIVDISLRQPGTVGNDGAGLNYDSLYSLLCLLHRTDKGADNWEARIFSEGNFDRDFRSRGANAIFQPWLYETGFTPNKTGEIYTFGPLKLRIRVGDGGGLAVASNLVMVEKCLFDSTTWTTVGTFDPTTYPGKYFSLNINAVSEHMRLRISGSNRVFLDKLILHIAESAKDRPRV